MIQPAIEIYSAKKSYFYDLTLLKIPMAGYITSLLQVNFSLLFLFRIKYHIMAGAVRKSKNQNAAVNSPAAVQERKKLRRGIILLLSLAVVLLLAALLFHWLHRCWFEKNIRFTVREIAIESNGFWGTSAETKLALISKLNINIGKNNIFELDLKKMRLDLRSFANVADAQLEIKLPDQLHIAIEERIPRAVIGSSSFHRVADANGVIMDSRQCMKHSDLPSIIGLQTPQQEIKPGVMLRELHPAMALLMAMERFPVFKAEVIKIGRNNELVLTLKYLRHNRQLTYYVTMPAGDFPQQLTILSSVIEEALRQRNTMNVLNMSFEGKVVFSR
ncbi:MAG: FtsQ-type POTRA domain-containing protein [Lentisphaerae bacterium]|nr:FtsQ-type POTRA domain-containing protein [Lentisphaerota bacterium]